MALGSKIYKVGDITVRRINELETNGYTAKDLIPDWDPSFLEQHKDWLVKGSMDEDLEHVIITIGNWIVKTPEHTILIDTSTGNDKNLPNNPGLSNLQLPYLQWLEEAGVIPEEVDYVLLTHLHYDHVGWNTKLVDGKWVPTFPNAKYIMPKIEEKFFGSSESHNEANKVSINAYEESVLPIIQVGLAEFIGPEGGDFMDGIKFIPSAGHSIGQMSISITSRGEEAFFASDVLHHPIQVYRPEWNSCFCEFDEQARESRLLALAYAADRNALYFGTHFPSTSAGYVSRDGDGFKWRYE
ncbi:MBL fold metallo-hydrolase [Paenibacillus monticola]|uniref:MBL fold metallo-hydrolase n=1 Tax=Paenibacillus monticola TaxID=2666075 RepID=A0A7X2L288_9BACL|nr:MBL fold metallo-hydrolase [Paenibacillus monticola]MRN53950.1 MBL fold metallo-hydrolase [Paenibacillus monticola]